MFPVTFLQFCCRIIHFICNKNKAIHLLKIFNSIFNCWAVEQLWVALVVAKSIKPVLGWRDRLDGCPRYQVDMFQDTIQIVTFFASLLARYLNSSSIFHATIIIISTKTVCLHLNSIKFLLSQQRVLFVYTI